MSNMCEKRSKKIKKGSQVNRLREARRQRRLQQGPIPPAPVPTLTQPPANPQPQKSTLCNLIPTENEEQHRILLDLTLKTIALMRKNHQIQQKITALQKETKDFVSKILSNPENRRRCIENIRIYKLSSHQQAVLNAPTSIVSDHPTKPAPAT